MHILKEVGPIWLLFGEANALLTLFPLNPDPPPETLGKRLLRTVGNFLLGPIPWVAGFTVAFIESMGIDP